MTFSLFLAAAVSLRGDKDGKKGEARREQNCHDGNFEGGRRRERGNSMENGKDNGYLPDSANRAGNIGALRL